MTTISIIYTRVMYHLLDISVLYEANAAFLWVNTALRAMHLLAEFGPVLLIFQHVIRKG